MGSTLFETGPLNQTRKVLTMQIEGEFNSETNQIRIIVSCESSIEAQAFHHHFGEMIKRMAEDVGAEIVDPSGVTGEPTSENRMSEVIKKLAKEANRGFEQQFRSNFL